MLVSCLSTRFPASPGRRTPGGHPVGACHGRQAVDHAVLADRAAVVTVVVAVVVQADEGDTTGQADARGAALGVGRARARAAVAGLGHVDAVLADDELAGVVEVVGHDGDAVRRPGWVMVLRGRPGVRGHEGRRGGSQGDQGERRAAA
jgi:hypothetical protein